MQNEIDKNLRQFKIKLVEEENQKNMGLNSDAMTEVETNDDIQTIGIDTEFDDVLMTRIISDKEKGLPKEALKTKLVELCNLETEKRLDDALGAIPEGEEIDQPLENGDLEKVEEKFVVPQAQQLAYLTLLNKITPKGDNLKGSIHSRINEIKMLYGINEDDTASETQSVDLMTVRSNSSNAPSLYSYNKIKGYFAKKAKQLQAKAQGANSAVSTQSTQKPAPKKKKKVVKKEKLNKELKKLEQDFKLKIDTMMEETTKNKIVMQNTPKKITEVHNHAIERYMQDLESKAKQEKQFINEAKRMREHLNSIENTKSKNRSLTNREVGLSLQTQIKERDQRQRMEHLLNKNPQVCFPPNNEPTKQEARMEELRIKQIHKKMLDEQAMQNRRLVNVRVQQEKEQEKQNIEKNLLELELEKDKKSKHQKSMRYELQEEWQRTARINGVKDVIKKQKFEKLGDMQQLLASPTIGDINILAPLTERSKKSNLGKMERLSEMMSSHSRQRTMKVQSSLPNIHSNKAKGTNFLQSKKRATSKKPGYLYPWEKRLSAVEATTKRKL